MSTSKCPLLSLPAECRNTIYMSLFRSIKITIRNDLLLLCRLRDNANALAPDTIDSSSMSPNFPLHRSLSVLLLNKVIAAEAGPLLASHITFHIQSIEYNMSRTDYLGKLCLALGLTRFSQIRYVQINHELTGKVLYGGLSEAMQCHSFFSSIRSITFFRTLFRVDALLERKIDYSNNEERYEVGVKDTMHVETRNIMFSVQTADIKQWLDRGTNVSMIIEDRCKVLTVRFLHFDKVEFEVTGKIKLVDTDQERKTPRYRGGAGCEMRH